MFGPKTIPSEGDGDVGKSLHGSQVIRIGDLSETRGWAKRKQ
jgi:hypothetical protein